jgi:hypothetical protein
MYTLALNARARYQSWRHNSSTVMVAGRALGTLLA